MERQVGLSCSASWLRRHLATVDDDDDEMTETQRNGECRGRTIVVDCRPTEAYNTAHIRGAVSLSLPTLMGRRLARRQLAACTVIGLIQLHQQQQQLTSDDWNQRAVVFYDDSTSSVSLSSAESDCRSTTGNSSCLVMLLAQRFNDDGHRAMILDGLFHRYTQH